MTKRKGKGVSAAAWFYSQPGFHAPVSTDWFEPMKDYAEPEEPIEDGPDPDREHDERDYDDGDDSRAWAEVPNMAEVKE